ncbi:MAG: hypothetical protein J5J06_15960 [Phycisphaerae bacterium]|nr:hypothetical protein [Phycisphaerae bacterium]
MESNEPIQRFRAGQVEGALWENKVQMKGHSGTILKATVARRYTDSAGNWRSSQSFARNEIPLAIYVLQKAFEAMIEKPAGTPKANDEVTAAVEEERVL